MARRGDRVRIRNTVLEPENRSVRIPDDTQKTPLVMWMKGFLINKTAAPGETVTVESDTGRQVSGELMDESPSWNHGFGRQVPELDELARRFRDIAREIRR